jgi:hypothetical protein
MKIELPKTIAVGDPVAICVGGGMIKWTEGCGYDMVGILPQGSNDGTRRTDRARLVRYSNQWMVLPMKIDGGLRPMFRDRFPSWHWTSIETLTVNGVPDAEFCFDASQGWIEYKFTSGYQVGLRPEQIGWALRRARAGGRSFIAVRRTADKVDELYLFAGADAARLKALRAKGRGAARPLRGRPARVELGEGFRSITVGGPPPNRLAPRPRPEFRPARPRATP